MAVFSKVTQETLQNLLSNFNIGELLYFEGIQAGIENTNYFIYTSENNYVLTIFEKLTIDQAPFYLSLMRHLAKRRTPCPLPILNKKKELLQFCNGKPATIVSRLNGRVVENPNTHHCYEIGKALAVSHQDASDFPEVQNNTRSLPWWKQTTPEILKFLPHHKQNTLIDELKDQESFFNSSNYKALPKAVIHADLFRDNALFLQNTQIEKKTGILQEKLGGIIDFYFAGFDTLIFDLAVVANDWAIFHDKDKIGTFKKNELDSLLLGYQSIRKLTSQETEAWPMTLRSAAFRFWISRLYDWYVPREATLLTPKDPTQFERILLKRKSEMKEKPC
ncbi:MAG: homoserine kinase [Betaproteobacteria bacterium TMED41]|nr:MAG: homoserine kinase [Betaproteobacteria bacterium TMED41]